MKKFALPLLVFLLSVVPALYNIGGFPKMMGDEGIYIAQAYWLTHFGELGPYTYWYDHTPLGWAQIGLWQLLVGVTTFMQSSVLTGRLFMGITLAGTSTLLYLLTLHLTRKKVYGLLASFLFITSALTLTFGRMVLLDNLAVFWLLASLLLLLKNPTSLKYLVISSITISLAILFKESLLFFLPPYLFLVYRLNKNNPHRPYTLFVSYATLAFVISFFPLLALLKGELFPQSGQVSLLGTLLYQMNRGTGIPFWQTDSHFFEMLSVWLSIDPVLIVLGGLTSTAIPFLNVPWLHKSITLFTFFFMLFLLRGGQIYDFYIIPLLPLLAINITLFLEYSSILLRSKALPYIFLGGVTVYLFSTALYPWTVQATDPQLQAINVLKGLPPKSVIVANNESFLDVYLSGINQIHWYQKVESDVSVRETLSPITHFLVDEQFERERSGGILPFLDEELHTFVLSHTFGQPLAPGQKLRPYENEHLRLYARRTSEAQTQRAVTLPAGKPDTDLLQKLKQDSPYAIVITQDNFTSSADLQTTLTLLKDHVGDPTKLLVMQDDTGNNTIPWILSPARSFYKSAGEAELATIKKSQALQALGITSAVITSSDNTDGYLQTILEAAQPYIQPIIRFDGTIPTGNSPIFVTTEVEKNTLENAKYQGTIITLSAMQN